MEQYEMNEATAKSSVLTEMLNELENLDSRTESTTGQLRSILGGLDNVTLPWEQPSDETMQDEPPSPNNHLKTLSRVLSNMTTQLDRQGAIIEHLNRVV